jgi:hypothetical protein
MKLLAGEVPRERLGDLVVEPFELGQALLDVVEVVEVVGGENLALDDREVDLDLACTGVWTSRSAIDPPSA